MRRRPRTGSRQGFDRELDRLPAVLVIGVTEPTQADHHAEPPLGDLDRHQHGMVSDPFGVARLAGGVRCAGLGVSNIVTNSALAAT
jgi:hypothetical protein